MVKVFHLVEKVAIPEGVEVKVNCKVIKVKGPRGELTRDFRHVRNLDMLVEGHKHKHVTLQMWFAARKTVASVRTVAGHVKNMIVGVTKGYEYKMRFVYAHFPINCGISEDKTEIKINNFLGEKLVRVVKMLPGVTVDRSEKVNDEIVLRYISFFDVVQRYVLAERDPTELGVNEPFYASLFYRASEQVVTTCEKARLDYQCDDVLSQLRINVHTPEGSEESSVVGCFQSPLVECTKRGIIIPRKKYKFTELIDLTAISTSPEVFWSQFSVHNQHFPVAVVTYADVANQPKLLTTILRYRPCTAVIGVPSAYLKSVLQKLCVLHETAVKQFQHTVATNKVSTDGGVVPCDRYQFLLSVIEAVRSETMIPMSLLNCPLPLPSFALRLSSSSTSS